MQCLNYENRITVRTVDGTKSGTMTFYLDDNGKCSVSPDITQPDREYHDMDTEKTWSDFNVLKEDLDSWCNNKPRDGEGRVIPFS